MKTNNNVNNLLVDHNSIIKLNNWDPEYTGGIAKTYVENLLNHEFINKMSFLQYKLFADKNQALLVVLQRVDTSGKDGTIRHAMNAFNPQNCKSVSFKKPNDEELSHECLWRLHKTNFCQRRNCDI